MSQPESLTSYPGGTHDITDKLQFLFHDSELAVGSLYIDEDSCT